MRGHCPFFRGDGSHPGDLRPVNEIMDHRDHLFVVRDPRLELREFHQVRPAQYPFRRPGHFFGKPELPESRENLVGGLLHRLHRVTVLQVPPENLRRLGVILLDEPLLPELLFLQERQLLECDLVRGIEGSAVKRKLVGSVAALCREMKMLVVAEGVETVAERDVLTELGCDLFQGFLFARPASAFYQPAF